MLQDRVRLNTPFGERAFSILLFQDLSIVPLITIIAALSRAPVDPAAPPGWQLAIHTVLAVAGLVLAGRLVLNPLFRLIGRIGAREPIATASCRARVCQPVSSSVVAVSLIKHKNTR